MRSAAVVTAGALVAGCLPHVLVLAGRLPHTALAGGRIPDARTGRIASAASIPVLVAEAGAALWAGIRCERTRGVGSVLAVHAAVTLLPQLVGTPFERRYAAPVCVVWLAGAVALAARSPTPR
ncbi:hypothetical protein [Dietzia sp. PP-33]|jgi:hypothetical protein|uniref:hypothetical protein n=1 Tax=Dietzia sp. PP-33 TaxID=2957500 RepID=UPI0029BAD5A0|nr:hypothetical protein [Dietzia sp. PP-33]MDX2355700.1 hypothetical protein [Dietzia sp. PP-33]